MENYIIANKTDVGQARSVNEDSMITFDSPNGRVVAVCDGMGGQAAGDVASQLACSIIRDILENNTFGSPEEAITRSIMAANQGILHRAAQDPQLTGMGSTCVMLIIKDGQVHYGWVGDSRIYYISNHTIRQISKDQSYVQSLVDAGQITAEEAEQHPQKNEILNALGLEGMTPPVLCQAPIIPEPNSVFLLCSDGLTGMVDNAQIERVVSRADKSLQEKVERLVELANANGGIDNITVQLVAFPESMMDGAASRRELRAGGNKGGVNKIIMAAVAVIAVIAVVVAAYFYFKAPAKSGGNIAVPSVDGRTAKPVKGTGNKTQTQPKTKTQPQTNPQPEAGTETQPNKSTEVLSNSIKKKGGKAPKAEVPSPNVPNGGEVPTEPEVRNMTSDKYD